MRGLWRIKIHFLPRCGGRFAKTKTRHIVPNLSGTGTAVKIFIRGAKKKMGEGGVKRFCCAGLLTRGKWGNEQGIKLSRRGGGGGGGGGWGGGAPDWLARGKSYKGMSFGVSSHCAAYRKKGGAGEKGGALEGGTGGGATVIATGH